MLNNNNTTAEVSANVPFAQYTSPLDQAVSNPILIVTVTDDQYIGIISSIVLMVPNANLIVHDYDGNGNPFAIGEKRAAINARKGLPLYMVRDQISALSQLVVLTNRVKQALATTDMPLKCDMQWNIRSDITAFATIAKVAAKDGKTFTEFKKVWMEKYKTNSDGRFYKKGERTIPTEIDAAVYELFNVLQKWYTSHPGSEVTVNNVQKLFTAEITFVSPMSGLPKEQDPFWRQLAGIFAAEKKNKVATTARVMFETFSSDPTAAAAIGQAVSDNEREYCRLAYLVNEENQKQQCIGFVKDSKLLPLKKEYTLYLTGRKNENGEFVLSNLKVNKAMSICENGEWVFIDTNAIYNAVRKKDADAQVLFQVPKKDYGIYNQIVLLAATARSASKNCQTIGQVIG